MKNIVIKTLITVFLLSVCLASADKNLAEENPLKDLIKLVMPATVLVMTYDAKGKPLAQGSGFFVSETGELITNYHVFKDAESITVKCPDNSVYKITLVIAEDMNSDLVKLQADTGGKKVAWLQLNKAKIEVGEKIVVIGSPQGLESTVSDGIVSAVRDVPGFGNIIQITASISPGSSGSAVVNMKGEVIGVASAQMREGQNLNFVVPAEKITALKEKKHAIAESKSKNVTKESDNIYSTALAYYLKEDYKKALPLLKQYLQKNPNSAEAWFKIGVCYGESGYPMEEIEAYKQAIRFKPDLKNVHYNLGVSYGKLGRYQEAIEAYKQAIKLKPNDVEAHYNLGDLYLRFFYWDKAIEEFKQIIKIHPEDVNIYSKLGSIFRKLSQYEESIESYKQVIKLKPHDAEAYYQLGETYANQAYTKWLDRTASGVTENVSLGSQEAVEAFKQAIKLKPDYIEAYRSLGDSYLMLKRDQEAIDTVKQAIKLRPDYAETYSQLGSIYENLERYEEAIEEFKQAIKVNPNYVKAHEYLGDTYDRLGRYQEAIEAYNQAIRLKPDNYGEYWKIGAIYKKLGRYQEEIETCKMAIKFEPNWAEAHNDLGSAYSESGRYQEAIDAYKQAIKLKPYYANAHYNLGIVYDKLKRYQEAIEAYKQAIKSMLSSDAADIHLSLGLAYLKIGDKGNALEEYKILKTLDSEKANELFNLIYK